MVGSPVVGTVVVQVAFWVLLVLRVRAQAERSPSYCNIRASCNAPIVSKMGRFVAPAGKITVKTIADDGHVCTTGGKTVAYAGSLLDTRDLCSLTAACTHADADLYAR